MARITGSSDDQVEWAVEGVSRETIEHVWDDAWPYLEQAVKRFPQVRKPFTEAQIYRGICKSEMQLWIAWSYAENRIVGAVLTETFKDPKLPGLLMGIPLVGADHWMKWGDTMWTLLKNWGRAQGCTHAVGYGRKGWCRLYGFDPVGATDDGIPVYVRRLRDN